MPLINTTTKNIFSNTAYQLIGKVVSMSITVFIISFISRTYGTGDYGKFNLMQTWPALFFIILDFGLNAIAVKELSKDFKLAQKYYSTILVARVILSMALILVGGLLIYMLPYDSNLTFGIQINMMLILTQVLYSSANIIYQTKLRYDMATISYIFGYLLILGLVIWLGVNRYSVTWVSFAYVIGGFLTAMINNHFLVKLGINFSFAFDKALFKRLLLSAYPLGIMFVFSQVNFKSDSLLLSILKLPSNIGLTNVESVGLYGLPYKIFEVLLVFPTFFMNSAYPILVANLNQNKDMFLKQFKVVVLLLFVAGLCASILSFIFSPWVISLIGGGSFAPSVTVLRILSLGLVIFFLTQPLSWLLVMLDKQKILPWIYLVGAIVNFSLNISLIPYFSFYASSVITLISELVILIWLVYSVMQAWKEKYV